jgi:serine/threonine-protein kinase
MNPRLLNNRYRLIKTLGRGGFGETVLAEDTHMPSGRKCVIKQLKPIIEQPKIPLWMKERFQREAAILEELGEGHSQIPRLYAYFSEADKFYLVQEWIEGVTLAQKWEQQGNLSSKEVKQILIDILPVLDYVHSRRIVHRDIKPENIILRSSDRLPVLIDFGAVKEAMTTVVNPTTSSALSASIGTPGYMPSEQAAGRPIYSSDLYSLGLTAIFLLTGKSPQELDTDPRTGEIIWQKYTGDLEAEMILTLEQAVRFHPRDRFSSAKEMFAALESGTSLPNLTGTTVKIAPGISRQTPYPHRSQKRDTVAVQIRATDKPKKSNWLVNSLLFLLIAGGVSMGAFVAAFTALSNFWASRPLPSSQAKIESSPTTSPEPRNLPPERESREKNDSILPPEVIRSILKSKQKQQSQEEETEEESEIPEVVIETKPESNSSSQERSPQESLEAKSQPEINVPIPTTGTSESQLVSTLGQPTSQRKDATSDSHTIIYRDVVPERVNLSYRSDSSGKIRQADVALAQAVSLGGMQQTLAELLGKEPPAAIKEKLREVYLRKTDFSFFKVDNLEGKIQRDSKDRVNISVWEANFQ